MKIENCIARWCEGELETAGLLQAFEQALTTLDDHRQALNETETSLSDRELEHCEELRSYCWSLLDELESSLVEASEMARLAQRTEFISAGDHIGRLTFQLNQALLELGHQALLIRGPTEIPNLNLLYWLNERHQNDSVTQNRYLAAVQSEILLAQRGMMDLSRETVDSNTLGALKETFREHIEHLKAFAQALKEGESDLTGYLLQVNLTYTEINQLGPLVAQELRDRGETSFPEVNRLLTLLEEVSLGRAADHHLFDSLERLERVIEEFEEAIPTGAGEDSSEDVYAETFEAIACFYEASEFIDEFCASRDVVCLEKAREKFLEFSQLLGAVPESPTLAAPSRDPIVTERLDEVYRAVDDILTARIMVDDYLQVLGRFGRHLNRQLTASKLEKLKRPIQVMLEGLGSLRKFAADGCEDHLKSGVLTLNQGALELQATMRP